MTWKPLLVALIVTTVGTSSFAQTPSESANRTIEQFLAHALFQEPYTCAEHAAGELPYLGDDLGQDCLIHAFIEQDGRAFMRTFATKGLTNEDWYGWSKPVLSPCDCTVSSVHVNSVTNEPGKLGRPPASSIELKTQHGISVVLAHIQTPEVTAGDVVRRGQVVARVGNNGFARAPHIHIGAWRNNEALQIRWDSKTLPRLQ